MDKILYGEHGQLFVDRVVWINTCGVNYSGRILKVYELGPYQIWRKNPGTCDIGRVMPARCGAWLVLVKVSTEKGYCGWCRQENHPLATEIEGYKSGGKRAKEKLLTRMKSLYASEEVELIGVH